ncbi:MAG: DUF1566 domain-containing protein [Bacteroidetes bacterium]|nr:DUF1566 domain-containing protein [Bacteroidota bacterium]
MKNTILLLLLSALVFTASTCSKTPDEKLLAIGDKYQEGIVAYLLVSGDSGYDANTQHGLLAAPFDQCVAMAFDAGTHVKTGAISTKYGSGKSTTEAILNAQGSGEYPASMCASLLVSKYDDWYLPSRFELLKMRDNKDKLGSFTLNKYWDTHDNSSNGDSAEVVDFSGSTYYNVSKKTKCRVRAVRYF